MIVSGTIQLVSGTLEFDDYVPVVARWPSERSSTPFYYRVLGGQDELIEVAVDPTTLAVCKVGVVSLSEVGVGPIWSSMEPAIDGLPLLERSPDWGDPPARSDIQCNVSASLVKSTLHVQWSGGKAGAMHRISAPPASFVVDQSNALIGLLIELPSGHDHALRLGISEKPPMPPSWPPPLSTPQ